PDHVHVIVKPQEATYSIADILSAIKSPSAKAIFSRHPELKAGGRIERKDRPSEFRFWQAGGGYDRNLVSGSATWSMIHYIHSNPVRNLL
ncbi:hypothetical protein C1Y30_31375, partial [Pseudomonas sp. GW704-F3]|uniref:transposase n=1 Tax=Pseudomonas sp. GW704-F3 TaxID=2070574 RepID=UPI000CBBD1C8